jgi:Icc-related predicted phosphoesterase
MYIHDTVVEIEGLKFFGSNFTPEFNNWAFNLTERQSKIFWENAPEADVVVCHGPPYGYCDSVTPEYPHERPLGCKYFLEHIKRTQPLLVIDGHIHGSHSQRKIMKHEDGTETLVVNVSVMDESYTVVAPATVITIDDKNNVNSN